MPSSAGISMPPGRTSPLETIVRSVETEMATMSSHDATLTHPFFFKYV